MVVLAIKLRPAPQLALLPVTIAEKKVIALESAPNPQNLELVSGAESRTTFYVTALSLRKLTVETTEAGPMYGGAAEKAEVEEEEEAEEVENVTNVVKLGTSLVRALTMPLQEGTMHLAAVVRRRLVISVVV